MKRGFERSSGREHRKAQILAMLRGGMNYTEIGEVLKLSRQWVQVILPRAEWKRISQTEMKKSQR